jgi:hypothetical protein
MAALCSSTAEVRAAWATVAGSCETGAMLAAPLLNSWLPETQFLVIRRDTSEVIDSLRYMLGQRVDTAEIYARAAMLDKFAAVNKVPVVAYEALQEQHVCEGIYAHLTGNPCPAGRWDHMARLNIQVERKAWVQTLIDNKVSLTKLKAELAQLVEAQNG